MATKEERLISVVTFFRQQDMSGQSRLIDSIQNIDGLFEFNGKKYKEYQLVNLAKIFNARLAIIYNPQLKKSPKVGVDCAEEEKKPLHMRELYDWIIPSGDFIEEDYD